MNLRKVHFLASS